MRRRNLGVRSLAVVCLILGALVAGFGCGVHEEKRALTRVFGKDLFSDIQEPSYHRDVDLSGDVEVRIDFSVEDPVVVDRLVSRWGLPLCGRPEDEIGWRLDDEGSRQPILRGRFRYCIENQDGAKFAFTYNPATGLCSYFESTR